MHASRAAPLSSGGDLCLGQIAVSSENGRDGKGGGGLVRVLF